MEQAIENRPSPPRLGPRPLPLHLMMAMGVLTSSTAALPALRTGSLSWNLSLRAKAQALQDALNGADQDTFGRFEAAVEFENCVRLDAVLRGIEAYHRHPYRRTQVDPAPVWQDGTTVLRAYGGPPDGPAVLVVPSLINRAYILDLSERSSFVRWLAEHGFRPFLVDWGAPGEAERQFSLTDYITERLEAAFDAVLQRTGGPIHVVGYCMGGLLALALAVRRIRDVDSLTLLATPWDFQKDRTAEATLVARVRQSFEPTLAALGELPVDMLQSMFAGLDPLNGIRKFARFADVDQDGAAARRFVALEDWLNDGVPLAAPTARDCLDGWYGENQPALKTWRVAGKVVDPGAFDEPALCVIPSGDRIVPPSSARPLAQALPRGETLVPRAGHIGMITGQNAEQQIWERLLIFIKTAASGPSRRL